MTGLPLMILIGMYSHGGQPDDHCPPRQLGEPLDDAIVTLRELGLIIWNTADSNYVPSKKGAAHAAALLNAPLPQQQWVSPVEVES